MNFSSMLFDFAMILAFLACIFYVIFGQITVRKLRKSQKTKEALGTEFVSGWDIINVAEALSLPRSWMKKLESGPLSALYAKSEILREHTTRLDKALGAVFFWLFSISGLSFIAMAVLSVFGIYE